MDRSRIGWWGALFVAWFLVWGGACSAGEGDPCEECEPDASGRDVPDARRLDVAPLDARVDGARPTDLVAIALEPADPVLEALQGAQPTVDFRVVGTRRDGTTRAIGSTELRLTVDLAALGTLDPVSGRFTSAGVGGTTRVRAVMVDGSTLSATTTLTVRVRYAFLTGVTEADRARLDAMTPSGAAAQNPLVDYPLHGAVMPQNVHAPRVMWTPRHPGAAATDIYRVRLVRPHARVEAWLTREPRYVWQVPDAAWRSLSLSDVGEPMTLTVASLSGGALRESEPRTFRTVDSVIAGAVYYWSPPRSRLMRLDVEAARLVDFLPNPGDTCIGCHVVSRDGRRLAGFLEGTGETLAAYDLTRDLRGPAAPAEFRVRYTVRRCTSYSPDATRLVSGDCGANPTTQRFTLIDTGTGRELAAAAGLAGDGFDPEWSPDGTAIAYTSRANDLTATPALPGDRFGTAVRLHAAASTPGGAMDWHPTWTPDSRWLVFQHGDTRRTGVATGASGVRGDLWIIARGGGAPVRLDRANGGPTATNSYRPVFSPFDSGGYFWLLFTSTRPFGNATAGVRGQKQIWVTAVRNRPDGGTDPSEVPYYLDGQEVATVLSPYWAPPPCRPNGQACSVSAECCSGTCEPDSSGASVCRPPTGRCHQRGEACGGASDCCEGLVCTAAHVCDLPSPG